MVFVLQTDGVDTYTLEKYAPQPLDCRNQERGATWWNLKDRSEALAMQARMKADGLESRIYEYPAAYESDGDEEWVESDDGLTLVFDEQFEALRQTQTQKQTQGTARPPIMPIPEKQ